MRRLFKTEKLVRDLPTGSILLCKILMSKADILLFAAPSEDGVHRPFTILACDLGKLGLTVDEQEIHSLEAQIKKTTRVLTRRSELLLYMHLKKGKTFEDVLKGKIFTTLR